MSPEKTGSEIETEHIQRMAALLLQGSTLTELACPVCASPLFRLKNKDLWCARCEKKVIVVRDGEEAEKATRPVVMDALEATLLAKIQDLQNKMQREENVEELEKQSKVLSELLDNLDKIKRMKRL